MAEEGKQPAGEQQEAVVQEGPTEAAASGDDAPKPRIKKPVKPDDEEYKAQMTTLQEQIDQSRKRMDEISRLISGKRGQNESPEGKALRAKMTTLRAEFQAELQKKQEYRAMLEVIGKTRENMKAQMKAMKGKIQYATVEGIDEQVRRLQEQHEHTSVSLAEEKKILEQIKTLKASRSAVAEYNAKMERMSEEQAGQTSLIDRLKASDAVLDKLKADMDKVRLQQDEIRAKESAASSDVPSLQDERSTCKAVVDAAYAKKNELYTAFKARMEEWREGERVWRVQRDEDRKKRQEAQRVEWEERQAARKARDAEMEGEPFYKEIGQCDQLLLYLAKYAEGSDAAAMKLAAAATTTSRSS